MRTPPQALPPRWAEIPTELTARPQWVFWRWACKNQRWTKPPLSLRGGYARTNDAATWASFTDVKAAFRPGELSGVGFCLSEDDGLTGIDLDHCVDPETLEITRPEAAEIIEQFKGTYIERSPSGEGLRIWCRGRAQRSGKAPGHRWVEVYTYPSHRYLTVTGHHREGSVETITDQQSALDWLHAGFMVRPSEGRGVYPTSAVDSDDDALLANIRKSKNGARFAALWNGDAGEDHSAADLSLANILCFWCRRDPERIDKLFRQSGLMRPKWDEVHASDGRTYGQITIHRAIEDGQTVFGDRGGSLSPSARGRAKTGRNRADDGASSEQHTSSRLPCAGNDPPAPSLLYRNEHGDLRRLIESRAAEVVAEALRGLIAFDGGARSWQLWRDTHWEPQTVAVQAEQIITEVVRRGTGHLGFRPAYGEGITTLICRLNLLPASAAPRDTIPFANGLLSTIDGTLARATPERAHSWCLPHEYTSHADCPTIQAWLRRSVDDDGETVELLRAWLAALVRGVELQKFLFLYGPAGSGKGTFQRLACALVGERNLAVTTLKQLEENRFEPAKLFGRRLAVVNEVGRYAGSINMLKAVTGGDSLPIERKHQ